MCNYVDLLQDEENIRILLRGADNYPPEFSWPLTTRYVLHLSFSYHAFDWS